MRARSEATAEKRGGKVPDIKAATAPAAPRPSAKSPTPPPPSAPKQRQHVQNDDMQVDADEEEAAGDDGMRNTEASDAERLAKLKKDERRDILCGACFSDETVGQRRGGR